MSKTTDPLLLMKPHEVARLLGFSARTLEKWRAEGGGPVFIKQSSRAIRYQLSDLAAWIEQNRRTSTSDRG
ncbi:MAG: helix-turn-helix domain-containing protein [Thermoanaerobaculia bacterium]|nr:helix-turn-helix domain-containing protein [Thermoanaerobaculia bacterium]